MRVLFVAYCMVDNQNGDSLIGVYKRAIRVGLELAQRGHAVWMQCPGRELFHDDLTKQAEAHFHFLDYPAALDSSRSTELRRRYCRMVLQLVKPDIVVCGEVPMAGTLLESTVCAVSLGIRVVALDNAYSPKRVRKFLADHGPMLDGVILTGPSSFQMANGPEYYCPVPPYIEGSSAEAKALLDQLGIAPRKLILVLAYERKAEQLAASLLPKLAGHECVAIFLTLKPKDSQERLRSLKNVYVLPLPGENLLFGLLQLSNLVIGKCGFMQVSESLALRTPFIGIQYPGCFPSFHLSSYGRRFVSETSRLGASRRTVRAAVRLLHTAPEKLARLHDGRFMARSAVADFLEELPPLPRSTTEESANLGYPVSVFRELLSRRHPDGPVHIECVRCGRIRDTWWGYIDALVCCYTLGQRRRTLFLWGRKYYLRAFATQDIRAARLSDSGRRVLFVSKDGRAMLEEDVGEWLLPTMPMGAAAVERIFGLLKQTVLSWRQRVSSFHFHRPVARTKGQA
jgi:UDP-N-acetylglucosamine:LPS N-acetylglucosamine transferase